MSHFIGSIMTADGLALLGDRSAADPVMTTFRTLYMWGGTRFKMNENVCTIL